ncbi:hypothetical protein ACWKSP_06060 [Micromonosporaceae bacterium Da 78-11]
MPALQPTHPNKPPRQTLQEQQPGLLTAIRRAADDDADVQRLSQHFGLRRPTIIKALTGQDPTTAQFGQQRPQQHPILQDVNDYLDRLIADNPDATIWSIWKKLQQERQTTVGYGTVRDYVNRFRADPADTTSVRHFVSRADLFAKIRSEAVGALASRLAARFSTDHATVMQALTSKSPPRRHVKSKQNPILEDLRQHIDEMIDSDPEITVATIWQRLVDQHHAQVSYGTVRDYVARERRQPRPRAKSSTITIPAQSKPQSGPGSARQTRATAVPGQVR